MIKTNVNTLATSREAIPANLIGLSDSTLRNLQTELNPVPANLTDIEYWAEDSQVTAYNSDTQKLGAEILTPNVANKTVTVTHEVVALSVQEMADNLANAVAPKIAALAAKSLEVEIQGVTVAGDDIATDRESVSRVSSALSLMGLNPTETTPFKTKGGWAVATKGSLESIQNAIWAHLKATATNEQAHSDAIDLLATASAVAAYDISKGWG